MEVAQSKLARPTFVAINTTTGWPHLLGQALSKINVVGYKVYTQILMIQDEELVIEQICVIIC